MPKAGILDFWEEAVKKAVNAKAKSLLQSFFSTHDIDLRRSRGNRAAKKEEKDSDGKNKSINSIFADIFSGKQLSFTQQTSSAYPKKDQNHGKSPWHEKGQGQDSPAMGVNVTPKKKERDLS